MTLNEETLYLGNQIFYIIFLILALGSQMTLLILIIKCTSKSMRDMRLYIINTLVLQIISTCSAYFTQCRVIPSENTVAMPCAGPCKYFGENFCFVTFSVLQGGLIGCASSLITAFYYRYKLLLNGTYMKISHLKYIVFSNIPPFCYTAIQFFTPRNQNIFLSDLFANHPDYIFDNYSIIGYSDTQGFLPSTVTIILMICLLGTPVIALIFRRKILKLLNSRQSQRLDRIENSKSMILGLTIQTIVPVVCYIPSVVYYILIMYYGNSNQLLEFVVSPLGLLYTSVDSILTIYFVLPYRRAFKHLILKHSKNKSQTFITTVYQSDNFHGSYQVATIRTRQI